MSDPPLALVTGASSGIGRALAKEFAEHGYDLIIAAEDVEFEAATEELCGYGHVVTPVQTDLTTRSGVERLWQAVQDNDRPLEAIALNAGVHERLRCVVERPV